MLSECGEPNLESFIDTIPVKIPVDGIDIAFTQETPCLPLSLDNGNLAHDLPVIGCWTDERDGEVKRSTILRADGRWLINNVLIDESDPQIQVEIYDIQQAHEQRKRAEFVAKACLEKRE